MSTPDPYVDSVLGEWKFVSKDSKKDQFTWRREATIKLHRDHAQMWTNPSNVIQKVYGEVTLTETKTINRKTSMEQRFRNLKTTKTSVIEDLIP